MKDLKKITIAVVGLGYVGLPLATAFARHFKVIGYDKNLIRIDELKRGIDRTGEMTRGDLESLSSIELSSSPFILSKADIIIVTVPTPITESKRPDLQPLQDASKEVGENLSKGSTVIFESTVYPGVVENFCAKIISDISGFELNKEFFIGYSPERINPGDKEKRLEGIVKLVSASCNEALDLISNLYETVIHAGVYRCSSIKIAEAAKVIENTQRDINIAFVNELSFIFDRLGLDTTEVLEAASTKWNFLNFKPGLVGGHCIGVDPYYLLDCAQQHGYLPKITVAGRETNDFVPFFIAHRLITDLVKLKRKPPFRILVLGITFKENCPDTRNSKVFDMIDELTKFGHEVFAADPYYNFFNSDFDPLPSCQLEADLESYSDQIFDAVLLAVPHDEYRDAHQKIKHLIKNDGLFYDLKSIYPKSYSNFRL